MGLGSNFVTDSERRQPEQLLSPPPLSSNSREPDSTAGFTQQQRRSCDPCVWRSLPRRSLRDRVERSSFNSRESTDPRREKKNNYPSHLPSKIEIEELEPGDKPSHPPSDFDLSFDALFGTSFEKYDIRIGTRPPSPSILPAFADVAHAPTSHDLDESGSGYVRQNKEISINNNIASEPTNDFWFSKLRPDNDFAEANSPAKTMDGAMESVAATHSKLFAILQAVDSKDTIQDEYMPYQDEYLPYLCNPALQTDRRRQNQSPSSNDEIASPSRSSTSEGSEETEVELLATILASEKIKTTTKTLLGHFSRFIEQRLSTSRVQHTEAGSLTNKEPKNSRWASTGLSGDQSGGGRRMAKRLRPDGDEYGDSGEAPNRDGPSSGSRNNDTHEKQKIACPFMKRFPAEFSTWRTCVGPGFDGMHRVKEHLKRRHFREHSCQRCGLYYDSNRLLQDHLRSPEPCMLQEVHTDIGFMVQLQWDDINKKRQGSKTPILGRWKEIYLILFPDIDESCIPSPYFDTTESMDNLTTLFDPEEYEAYLRKHLPSRIMTKLTKEFQIMSDEAKERLAAIVQEESLETLKTYMLRKGTLSSNDLSNAGPPALDAAFNFDGSIFEDINLYGSGDQFDYSNPFRGGDEWESSKGKEPQPPDSGYGSLL